MPFDDRSASRRFVAVWSFVFTDPDDPVLSCRVAAESRGAAVIFLETALNRPVVTQPHRDPSRRVIVQNMGSVALPQDFPAELLEIVERRSAAA